MFVLSVSSVVPLCSVTSLIG